MEITWDEGRIWHSDCTTRGSGIMVPLVKEQDRTLFKCLMCDKQGYYPHGGSGTWCTSEVHNVEVMGASRLAGEASSREAATSTVGLEGCGQPGKRS